MWRRGISISRRSNKIFKGDSPPAGDEALLKALYSAAAKANNRVLFEIFVE
jgi:hypothetical protein